jgi:hypothetical protein
MKPQVIALTITTLFLTAMLPGFTRAEDPPAKARERIGVYDSRSVAIAFAGSTHLKRELEELSAKHKKAKDAGDEKEVSRLQVEGQAWQAKLHQQGFSTAPVEDILVHISGDLPKIKSAAGVTAIISKWDTAELKKHPGAEKVDVTTALIEAITPDDRARKNALEIQQKAPVPREQIDRKD